MKEQLDTLFREQRRVLSAALLRAFGPANLDVVETAIQEAFLRAVQSWQKTGMPDNPAGWLMTVARNQAVDSLRREGTGKSKRRKLAAELDGDEAGPESPPRLRGELGDDALRMMFVACHPALGLEAQLVLVLRTLCGMELTEIAKALLTQEQTVAKRLVRAKQKLREVLSFGEQDADGREPDTARTAWLPAERVRFDHPPPAELVARLSSVLKVLYLLFSEGYSSHQGERLLREDLCHEAIRLGTLLVTHPLTQTPKAHALLALMLLQASRLAARTDLEGNVLTLKEQNRKLWDKELIHRGLVHLAESASGDELSELHLEAAIAAAHATAPSFERTEWPQIVRFYDQLRQLNPSPVIALNRAVAIGMWQGPQAGLRELQEIADAPLLRDYFLLHAALAHFHAASGASQPARLSYARALDAVGTAAERRFIEQKLASLPDGS